jgi:hypothetical protein
VTGETVSIRAFQGASKLKQAELVPDLPGLYLWTHDLRPLVNADDLMVQARLLQMLGLVGQARKQQVRPYYHVTVTDQRVKIADAKRLVLHDAFSSGISFGTWLADLATHFQRPLYAGMTLSLHRRIIEHLAQGSKLRLRLEKAGADVLDLALTWIAAPEPAPSGASALAELDAQLKAAESLLIRLTMPMFNEKQD